MWEFFIHCVAKQKLLRLVRLAVFALLMICAGYGLLRILDKCYPLSEQIIPLSQMVVADDGSPLWHFPTPEGIWRYPVAYEDVSPFFIQALLEYEDKYFYLHSGINYYALLRAMYLNIRYGRIISGGSTLSMQVSRLLYPHKRTVLGKMQQLFRTWQLERNYSKKQILTFYLNLAPYGGTFEGIGAASWAYLGKSPAELTKSEAILMTVLPQSPSRLRPDRYPERAQKARNKVVDRLMSTGFLDAREGEIIKNEAIWLIERRVAQYAPLLARRLAKESHLPLIKSTINVDIQRRLEYLAENTSKVLPEKTSLAFLVVDHTTMEVKGYVGSADFYNDDRFGHVDMIESWRSPGSTLKPLLFSLAMDDKLIHSESLLQDIPRLHQVYQPQNFEKGFMGPVGAAEALIRSLNLPFVQLMEHYGPKRFTAKLRNSGMELKFPVGTSPNLSLILGGTAVKLEQLVMSYSAYARQGNVSNLRFYQNEPLVERPLFSAESAWIVRRILAGMGRPERSGIVEGVVPLAWKTGTSYGYRDAWSVGVNARYTIGVWVGRPDGSTVAGQYGAAVAYPLLGQIDEFLLSSLKLSYQVLPRDPKPENVIAQDICWPSGQYYTENDSNCLRKYYAWTIKAITPMTLQTPDDFYQQSGWLSYWVNDKGLRVAADCPGAKKKQLALWPPRIEPWVYYYERNQARLPTVDPQCPVIGKDLVAKLRIEGIAQGDKIFLPEAKSALTIPLMISGGSGRQWWFINGELVSIVDSGAQFNYELTTSGEYQVVVLDESGQIDRLSFHVQ